MTYYGTVAPRRSSVEEFDAAIQKAVGVLKGSATPPTPQQIAKRARTYLSRVGESALVEHIRAYPASKLAELGIRESNKSKCRAS